MRKVILAATSSIIIFLSLFLASKKQAHPDISMDLASKTYQVKFSEWVRICLHVDIAESTSDYHVVTYANVINGKVRFMIEGWAANTVTGKNWYQENVSSIIPEKIRALCRLWTNQGYPISMNDFEINIKQL